MNPEHKLEEQTFKLVSWPSPQDYQEAIQAPLLNVDDQELKAGQVELNALGLPRPRTGFFATVYKMQCRSTDWAVRCFLNNIQDQKLRYAELSKFVMSDKLDSTVGFHYVEQGIKVGGTWYPILKMEWVEGVTFGEYIEDRVRDFAAMRQLALKFEEMMLTLQEAGVAHGDLQHGNIIVSRSSGLSDVAGKADAADTKNSISLRLVDYDGMFVPQLGGWQSNEIGHRNYQHPKRNATHFGATLDNFSAWVIYCSLICLAVDPTLWDELEGGDECLLFRQEDFRDIKNSRAFSIMLYHPSPVVRECADWIAKILEMPPDKVPFLSASTSRAQALSEKQRVRRAVDARKASAKSAMKKTAGAHFDEAQAQAESPRIAPSHLYPQIISPKGSKGRMALLGFLVSVVLMWFTVFGQALFNRNPTMFPKSPLSGGAAAKNKLELPKVFFESEDGHMSTWTYSPVVDESNEPLKRNARRYEVAWDNGATSEVYVQAPKSGQVTATRKDLTGSTRGMQVRYEGGWNGEVFSGVANYVYQGRNVKTVTFKAYPKKSESNWLKRTNDGQDKDEFKR